MIHFRDLLRSFLLHGLGAISPVSPGVHILAGHYMGRELIKSPEVFHQLLMALSKSVRFINIEVACDLILRKVEVDEALVAFTFDDGFVECYTHIAPALESYGVNAAFFVNPGFVFGDDDYIKKFTDSIVKIPGKKPMSCIQIKELANKGFIIGAHTIDHVDLRSTDEDFLRYQIVECKKNIELFTGVSCDWFAWTFGGYKHISEKALEIAVDTYDIVFSSDEYGSYTSKNYKVLNRRHFEPDWPASHVKFFLRKPRQYTE